MTPWTVVRQAPLFMGFPRQEYWSGLPFPPLGNSPNPGIKPTSPALAGRFLHHALSISLCLWRISDKRHIPILKWLLPGDFPTDIDRNTKYMTLKYQTSPCRVRFI